jgi:hypothetical protein
MLEAERATWRFLQPGNRLDSRGQMIVYTKKFVRFAEAWGGEKPSATNVDIARFFSVVFQLMDLSAESSTPSFWTYHPMRTDSLAEFKEMFGGRVVKNYICETPLTSKGKLFFYKDEAAGRRDMSLREGCTTSEMQDITIPNVNISPIAFAWSLI